MRFLFIFCLIFCVKFIFAQTKIDSLERELPKIIDAKQKLKFYVDLSYEYLEVNPQKTIFYASKCLQCADSLHSRDEKMSCFSYMGRSYFYQKDYQRSLFYFNQQLKLSFELKDKKEIAKSYSNIGIVYRRLKKYDSTLYFYDKSLELHKELNDSLGMSTIFNNRGVLYDAVLENFPEALKNYNAALKIQSDNKDFEGVAVALLNIADVYRKMKLFDKGIATMQRSIKISDSINFVLNVKDCYFFLSQNYADQQNYKVALEYFQKYSELNDTIFQREQQKMQIEMETKYQTYEKDKEIQLQQAEMKKQNILLIFAASILILITVLSVVIYRNYKIKRRDNILLQEQKEEILQMNNSLSQYNEEVLAQRDEMEVQNKELQKAYEIIEQKNKNITDSIRYARRIQSAVSVYDEYLQTIFENFFILYKPKDIVSGDFYFAKKIPYHSVSDSEVIIIVAVDCTGHGVPGAFMSMLGIALLSEVVNRRNVNSPAVALWELRSRVKQVLHQTGKINESQDGMDIAFCAFYPNSLRMEFAGAHHSLYIFRKNESEEIEFLEYKGDKMPIGVHPKDFRDFTNYEIQLQKNDTFYIFSDGYVSQFGGEKNEKFGTKHFRNLLFSLQNEMLTRQKDILDETLTNWQKNCEQVDDILVMGIKI